MAISFVQKITGSGEVVNSVSLIFGSNNTAGNFISVGAFWYTSDGTASAAGDVTDTRNTYALDRSRINGTAHVGLWSTQNVGAGANTVVVNPPAADAYLECVATEFSGIATSSAFDVGADNAATSTTPTSGTTATTAQADALAIAALSHVGSAATGIDLPSGYTNLHLVQDNSTRQPGSVDYLILTATGTQSASWGTTASSPWAGAIVVYKAAAGGGSPFSLEPVAPIAMTGVLGISAALDIVTAQILVPASDVSAGSWSPSSGVDLYAMLDEADPSDSDYILTLTLGDECTVALQVGSDPFVSTGHVVRYRLRGDGSSGITVALLQGASLIASWTHDPAPSTFTTFEQTLSGGEADSITDYTALRLRFTEV